MISQVGRRSLGCQREKIHMRDCIRDMGTQKAKSRDFFWSISTRVEIVDNLLNLLKPRFWCILKKLAVEPRGFVFSKPLFWQWGLSRVLALSRRGDRSIMEMDMFCFPYLKLGNSNWKSAIPRGFFQISTIFRGYVSFREGFVQLTASEKS